MLHRYGTFLRGRAGSGGGGGGGPPVLQLTDASYSSTDISPTTSSFTLANTGLAGGADIAESGPLSYSWLTGGAAADYEAKVTTTTGTFTTGTTGTWISLGTNRSWTVTRSTIGSKSCLATYEIRAAADPGVVLVSASIRITATVTS